MSDDFTLDIGDLPEDPNKPQTKVISDTFDYAVGYKFAFVGVGQAGGRIVKTFQEIGYSRICAINTSCADLAELKTFPDEVKLDIGDQQGAGKDPATSERIASDKDEEIYSLFSKAWGDEVDYVFVCLSGAGGTGAGAYAKVANVAKQFMRDKKLPNRVGCIMALPKDSEGQRAAKNVLYSMRQLSKLNLSPIVFIDNERFKALYRNVAVQHEKPASNGSTARLLHTFNRLAGTESEDVGGTSFDPADFSRLLNSGVIAFASVTTAEWSNPTTLADAIRSRLRDNTLASIDLRQGKVAGLLYVITGPAWDGDTPVTIEAVDYGTASMDRLLNAEDSSVFYGVYPAKGKEGEDGKVQMLAMVGGLPMPVDRIKELAAKAGTKPDDVAELFGV